LLPAWGHESAVLVIGIAHLHSMCVKLKDDFDIQAWAFAPELFQHFATENLKYSSDRKPFLISASGS
jgi:hypothetical protein